MGDHVDYLKVIAWTANTLTIIVAFVFLINFSRIKEKTASLYLVLVLSLSDLTYPLLNTLTMQFVNGQTAAVIFSAIGVSIYHFSLFWSTIMAIFCYCVLDYRRSVNIRAFVTSSVLACLTLATLFGFVVGFQIWGIDVEYISPGLYKVVHPLIGVADRIYFGVFYHGVGGLTPVAITAYCYYKVYETLKEIHIYSSFQAKPARVLWYAAIQVICFAPEMLIDLYYLARGEIPTSNASMIMYCLKRLWPVLNLLAYWFVMDVTGPVKITNDNDEEENENERSMLTVDTSMKKPSFLHDV